MLVLTRRPGERIMMGENVCITVLEINGNKIRLGVEAPREVAIRRAEVPVRAPVACDGFAVEWGCGTF